MLELHKRNLLKGAETCKLDFYKFCVMGSRTGYNSRQLHTRHRAFWTMFILMFGDLIG
jgi:hypothetical protein